MSEAAAPAVEQAVRTEQRVPPADRAGVLRRLAGADARHPPVRRRSRSGCRFAGKIPGGIHSSEGQEGVAVGTAQALGPDDVVSGTHRSHHHALAKGLTPR